MTFDPQKHMKNLSKNQNQPRWYLETKWRLVWMLEDHADWHINTEILNYEPAVVKATIIDSSGAFISSGHGSANKVSGSVYSGREIEKAETAAIGRALAHAGYGTQFTGEDEAHLADSPQQRKPAQQSTRPVPAPSSPASNVTQPDAATWAEHGTVTTVSEADKEPVYPDYVYMRVNAAKNWEVVFVHVISDVEERDYVWSDTNAIKAAFPTESGIWRQQAVDFSKGNAETDVVFLTRGEIRLMTARGTVISGAKMQPSEVQF